AASCPRGEPMPAARPVLTDFFGPVARQHAGRPTLRWREGYRHRGITFAELEQAVLAAAQRLHEQGVQPGDRTLLLGPSGPAWVVAFLGIVRAGGVAVPLDESTRPDFAAEVGRRTGARLQVVQSGFATAAGIASLPLESFHP